MTQGTTWIVSEDGAPCDKLFGIRKRLGLPTEFPACSDWSRRLLESEASESEASHLKWVFVDLREEASWNRAEVLQKVRDKLRRRGIFLIGLVQDGYTFDQAAKVRPLLDGALCMPVTDEHLQEVVKQCNASRQRPGSSAGVASGEDHVIGTEQRRFITRSSSLFSVFEEIRVTARHDFTILLVGKTGTGKTFLSNIIHELSPRSDEPFVHVACGTLQNELIDSELFGHVKGSFTGADSNKEGKFAAAKHGTLLLDEIDVLGMPQQAKLLRVLESGEYERVGCNETRKVNCRVIVTTNVDLESLIEKKLFRADLYFRLKQIRFEIPPLHNRPIDILPMTSQFIKEFCHTYNKTIHRMHPDFLSAIEAYSWPGNVRELRNEISRAVVFSKEGTLELSSLSPMIQRMERTTGNGSPQAGLATEIAQTEQVTIERMLRVHNFNRSATARALGISRVTLYNKIRKYCIQVSSPGRATKDRAGLDGSG